MALYWGYRGIMEKKMETAIVYWVYIGIMGKKLETTIMGLIIWGLGFWLQSQQQPCSGGFRL